MPLRPTPRRARVHAAISVIAAWTALLAACAGAPGAGVRGDTDPAATPSASGPQPTVAVIALPDQRIDAGTVSSGAPVTLTGQDAALVSFVRGGDFGVVARFDCSACSGEMTLTEVGREVPWGQGTAPASGTYLVDLHEDVDPDRQLLVTAEGPWSLELLSWDDLPVASGPQQGTGAAVLRLGDPGATVQWALTADPAGLGFYGRAIPAGSLSTAGTPGMVTFGTDQPAASATRVTMPGLVAVSASGSWTLTVG